VANNEETKVNEEEEEADDRIVGPPKLHRDEGKDNNDIRSTLDNNKFEAAIQTNKNHIQNNDYDNNNKNDNKKTTNKHEGNDKGGEEKHKLQSHKNWTPTRWTKTNYALISTTMDSKSIPASGKQSWKGS